MPVSVLVGCQWGDEGKGKVADSLASRADWVARFSGGHNAGHTVCVRRERFVLHLIPCGILQKKPRCVIGHGTVVDPAYLIEEMDALESRKIPLSGRLFVSEAAHVLLPYHRWLERLERQDSRIGTTGRGIGPGYQDKAGRVGVRMHELLRPERLRAHLDEQAARLEERFRGAGEAPPIPLEQAVREWTEQYAAIGMRLAPYVCDTVDLLHKALRNGERILCEGAQGTFLDLDLGTYPFVTSSTTTAGGAATGLGLPPASLKTIVGVCKAYTTRVGEGPFPTELHAEEGTALREKGAEYGATTGRPRRVGWLDLVQLRQAVRVNGVTELALTKADILTGMPSLRLCVRYAEGGRIYETPPVDHEVLARCTPEYEEIEGWSEPIGDARKFGDLPPQLRAYVSRIEALVECPIRMVSVGTKRNEVAKRNRGEHGPRVAAGRV